MFVHAAGSGGEGGRLLAELGTLVDGAAGRDELWGKRLHRDEIVTAVASLCVGATGGTNEACAERARRWVRTRCERRQQTRANSKPSARTQATCNLSLSPLLVPPPPRPRLNGHTFNMLGIEGYGSDGDSDSDNYGRRGTLLTRKRKYPPSLHGTIRKRRSRKLNTASKQHSERGVLSARRRISSLSHGRRFANDSPETQHDKHKFAFSSQLKTAL